MLWLTSLLATWRSQVQILVGAKVSKMISQTSSASLYEHTANVQNLQIMQKANIPVSAEGVKEISKVVDM